MTEPDTAPPFRLLRRLRPGSPRELRLIRLAWLTGETVAGIAGLMGRHPSTIRRRLKLHGLAAPAEAGEVVQLVAEAMADAVAQGLLRGEDAAVKDLVTLLSEVAAVQRAAGAAGIGPRAGRDDGGKAPESTETDDWRDSALGDLERLVGLDEAIETKAAKLDQGGRGGEFAGECEAPPGSAAVPGPRPRYAGAAAGPFADMVAFGRTWRRQDTGRGGMGALGGSAGGLPEGGAGGADLLGCARSDDRGAERADPAGDAGG